MSKAWAKGKVRWFDSASGRGTIEATDGTVYSVHYSAIDSKKQWKTLRENKKVTFQVLPDGDYAVIAKVKEVR